MVVTACRLNDRNVLAEHNKVILCHSGSVTRMPGMCCIAACSYSRPACLSSREARPSDGFTRAARVIADITAGKTSVRRPTRLRCTGGGSNPGAVDIFRACVDRPWRPPSFPYNVHRVFPGDQVAGTWCWSPIHFYRRCYAVPRPPPCTCICIS